MRHKHCKRRLFLLVGSAVIAACASRHAVANPPAQGYQLLWSSQFNGDSLNPLKWNFGQPWGSNVPPSSNSIGEPGNVTVSDNTLNLTAQNQPTDGYGYTTGLVNTSGLLNFTYGYVEADIKVPYTLGTWPAFWMLQNGWPPEIDVMEVPQQTYNYQPGSVGTSYYYYGTYHYTGANGQPASAGTGMHYTGVNEATSFNNYGMMWAPNSITFYFNGNPVDTITGTQANIAQAKNMYLLLDLAIGGWPGNPPSWANFPTTMQVQNVNVWQLPPSSNMTMNWISAAPNAQWNSGSSWQNGAIPNLGSESAIFGPTNSANTNVQWNDFLTVGQLIFQGGTTNYTLGEQGTSGLMLADDAGTAVIEANRSQGQSDVVSLAAELDLYNNTNVINNMATAMHFDGNVYGLGALSIQGGAVDITSEVSNGGGISVDHNGILNIDAGTINTPTDDINLSTAAGSNAGMTVTLGSVVNASVLRVGGYNGGDAVFTENGGHVETQTWFVIGQSGSAQGTTNINGGELLVRAGGGVNGDLELGVFNNATGVLNIAGSARVTLLNGANIVLGSRGTTGNGTVNQNGGVVDFVAANGSTAGSGALILGRDGSSGVYTYNLNGGILQTAQIETTSGTSNFNFSGGTLEPNENNVTFMQGLSRASIGTAGGTINTNDKRIVIGQSLSGSGPLTVDGNGTLTLSAANTYSGGTLVSNATLVLANAAGSATGTGGISIEQGGVLSGQGTAAGNVVIDSGGQLSPGNADAGGVLSIDGNATIHSGSTLNYYFSAPSNETNKSALLEVTGDGMGNLTLGRDVTVKLLGGSQLSAGVYQLIYFSGGLTNPGQSLDGWTLAGVSVSGMSYRFTADNVSHYLSLVISTTPTPEPTPLAILATAMLVLPLRRKFLRRQKKRLSPSPTDVCGGGRD